MRAPKVAFVSLAVTLLALLVVAGAPTTAAAAAPAAAPAGASAAAAASAPTAKNANGAAVKGARDAAAAAAAATSSSAAEVARRLSQQRATQGPAQVVAPAAPVAPLPAAAGSVAATADGWPAAEAEEVEEADEVELSNASSGSGSGAQAAATPVAADAAPALRNSSPGSVTSAPAAAAAAAPAAPAPAAPRPPKEQAPPQTEAPPNAAAARHDEDSVPDAAADASIALDVAATKAQDNTAASAAAAAAAAAPKPAANAPSNAGNAAKPAAAAATAAPQAPTAAEEQQQEGDDEEGDDDVDKTKDAPEAVGVDPAGAPKPDAACALAGAQLVGADQRLLAAVRLPDGRVVPAGTVVDTLAAPPEAPKERGAAAAAGEFAGVLPLAALAGAIAAHCPPPPSPTPSPPPAPQPAPVPAPTAPPADRPAAKFDLAFEIDAERRDLPRVPPSFLGLSHEWPHVEELAGVPGYADLLRQLGAPGGGGPPVVRIGGGSTDIQRFVPGDQVWEGLNKLHAATGVKYILGLNLEAGDPQLARKQMQAAEAKLAPGSILSFEIGNEPNFYENKNGHSFNDYIGCCFLNDFQATAAAAACPDANSPSDPSCRQGAFVGPAWGHVYMYPSTMDWFLRAAAKWVSMTTVHWYRATKEAATTPEALLEEAPLRREMDNLRRLVEVSNRYGKPLRVAETNSISNSGRDGVSNVFAAALWTLDACFEAAAAGSVGVNFHQGAGQNLYSALVRWHKDGALAPVLVRPPYYALKLFADAAQSDARLLPARLAANGGGAPDGTVKAWPVWDESRRELRVVLINKLAADAANVTLRADRSDGYGDATVVRLVASGARPLEARGGAISLGGLTYSVGAKPSGAAASEAAARAPGADGRPAWRIYMPAGSAALVTIKR